MEVGQEEWKHDNEHLSCVMSGYKRMASYVDCSTLCMCNTISLVHFVMCSHDFPVPCMCSYPVKSRLCICEQLLNAKSLTHKVNLRSLLVSVVYCLCIYCL